MKKWNAHCMWWIIVLILCGCRTTLQGEDEPRPTIRIFKKNGGWCWFQDERAIVDGNQIVFASVAGTDRAGDQAGDIHVSAFQFKPNKTRHFELHDRLQRDDHAQPALLKLPDGRYLAMYSTHGTDPFSRYRITREPGDIRSWTDEQRFRHPAGKPTYSNLFRLTSENNGNGRIYNFTRASGWDPNVMISDDGGHTWNHIGHLLTWPGRPYVKYASNGTDTIHFVTTDQHPRDYPNDIWHGFIRDGTVHDASGNPVTDLKGMGVNPSQKKDLTRFFNGDPHNAAWTVDLHLDRNERPVTVFSVQKDGATFQNNRNEGPGWDHRYFYARRDADSWRVHEMAYAGSGLYPREADYTGLAAIDPGDPETVFVSSDVHPKTGLPNVSEQDGKRHYEIFKGQTPDGGKTWKWKQITRNSTVDNLRPIVPIWKGTRRAVLWQRGRFNTYKNYDTDIVGFVEQR